MRSKSDWLMILLTAIFSCFIFGFFYRSIQERDTEEIVVKPPTDLVEALKFEGAYLNQLVITGFMENGRSYDYRGARVYELNDGRMTHFRPISDVFSRPKSKLIIRYTEIGCNSCADSTFKYINRHKTLESFYDILVLVDFSNYDAYLKWRKISEISYPVLWVKKGDLPYKIESGSNSFIFTVNSKREVNNFFVPNSKFAKYIDMYFHILESRNG